MVKDREAWHPAVHGVTRRPRRHSPSRLGDGTLGGGRSSVQAEFTSLTSESRAFWLDFWSTCKRPNPEPQVWVGQSPGAC